jgi:cytochrome bd-type quinol oxidase subunit 2
VVSKAVVLVMILGLGIIMYAITMSQDGGIGDVTQNTSVVTTVVSEPDPSKTWIDNIADFFSRLTSAWDK